MEQRVVITGMGVISPVGNNINDFWTSLAEGRCGIDHIKGFEEYDLPISVAGQVKDFAPEENGLMSDCYSWNKFKQGGWGAKMDLSEALKHVVAIKILFYKAHKDEISYDLQRVYFKKE